MNAKSYRYGHAKQFENDWSITYEKPMYDALSDPHASYYFMNRSIKKHLLHLRKTIEYEGKHTERKQIQKMIKNKLNLYDSINRTTKVQAYNISLKSSESITSLNSSLNNRKSKSSLAKSQSKSKMQKRSRKVEENSRNNLTLPKIEAESQRPNQSQQAKLNSTHISKHNKFLKFLEERKKKLSSQASVQNIIK